MGSGQPAWSGRPARVRGNQPGVLAGKVKRTGMAAAWMHGAQQAVPDAVVHPDPVAPVGRQPDLSQLRQAARYVGLGHAKGMGQLAHA
jgi:hypothetical protein